MSVVILNAHLTSNLKSSIFLDFHLDPANESSIVIVLFIALVVYKKVVTVRGLAVCIKGGFAYPLILKIAYLLLVKAIIFYHCMYIYV